MNKEIKPWIIQVTDGLNCYEYYGSYSIDDPIANDKIPTEFYMRAEEDLWNDYSYIATGWDYSNMENNYEEDPEAWEEEYEQIIEDFKSDISYSAYIDEDNEIDDVEIVYDEREK